jgi:hypothetical protein
MQLPIDHFTDATLVYIKECRDPVLVFTSPVSSPHLNGIAKGQSVAWFARSRHNSSPTLEPLTERLTADSPHGMTKG